MIKPFKILSVRDEADGGKTVFITVSKSEQITETKRRTQEFHTAIYVDAGLDIDDTVFEFLQKGGWIDA